ncbi:MAG: glycosyltransferase family 4 protein [Cyclobacteriaceae bacterium]
MKSLTITFCTVEKPDRISGVHTWIKNLCTELTTFGHRPHIVDVLIGNEGIFPLIEFANEHDIEIDLIKDNNHPYTESKVRKILEILEKRQTDVLLPGFCNAAYYTIPYLKEANIPTVVVLHSDDDLYKTYFEEFVCKKWNYRADAVVAVSEFIFEWTKKLEEKYSKGKISYGVNIPKKYRQHIENRKLKLVYSGRLDQQQKRVLDIFESFKMIVENVGDVECYFLGDGSEKEAIINKIEERGEDKIHYAGSVPSNAVQSELLKYDAMVLLSDYEGLPLAMLEAMACGLVVVCLRIDSGVDQLIKHKVNGLIVENRNTSFLEAIEYLVQNPEHVKVMGNAARQTITNQYSSRLNAEKWISFLDKICKERKNEIRVPRKFSLPDNKPSSMNSWNKFEREVDRFLLFKIKVKSTLLRMLKYLPALVFDNLLILKRRLM